MLLPKHMTEAELIAWGERELALRTGDLQADKGAAISAAASRRTMAKLSASEAAWAVSQALHIRNARRLLASGPATGYGREHDKAAELLAKAAPL